MAPCSLSVSGLTFQSNLLMEAADSSESSLHIYQTTQCHISEYYLHHSHHWEDLKSLSGHLALRFMSTMGKTASVCPPSQFNIQLGLHISCDVTKYCQYKAVTKGFSQRLPSYLQRYKLWQTSGAKQFLNRTERQATFVPYTSKTSFTAWIRNHS